RRLLRIRSTFRSPPSDSSHPHQSCPSSIRENRAVYRAGAQLAKRGPSRTLGGGSFGRFARNQGGGAFRRLDAHLRSLRRRRGPPRGGREPAQGGIGGSAGTGLPRPPPRGPARSRKKTTESRAIRGLSSPARR